MHYWNITSQFPSYPIIFPSNQRNRKIHHRDTKKINIPNGAIFRLIRQHLPRQARSPLNLGIKRWQCSQLTEDTHTHLLLLFFFFGEAICVSIELRRNLASGERFQKGWRGGGEGVPPIVPRRSQFFNSPYIRRNTVVSLKKWRKERERKNFE